MYRKHVNTRSSYCVSVVVIYKIWWAYVGTLSDFATLLPHNTTERLPTPGLDGFVKQKIFCPLLYSNPGRSST
jgi:hypothetical protein